MSAPRSPAGRGLRFGARALVATFVLGILGGVPARAEERASPEVRRQAWCDELTRALQELKWRVEPCRDLPWREEGESVLGRPLMLAEFGDPKATNVTLVLSMIHGDEVTPLFLGIELGHWLRQNPDALKDARVVLAPLVNPDSFYSRPRTRTNARGVDLNRNLPTRDWEREAHRAWKSRFSSNPRRFPGQRAASEPETLFQTALIERVRPTKILSIHAPLNFMDYDGPNQLTLAKFPKDYVQECLKLRNRLKARSGGFFPGSLGNYAGQERGIPTLTLELPTANPRKARVYWNEFSGGIRQMIEYRMPELAVRPGFDRAPSRQSAPAR